MVAWAFYAIHTTGQITTSWLGENGAKQATEALTRVTFHGFEKHSDAEYYCCIKSSSDAQAWAHENCGSKTVRSKPAKKSASQASPPRLNPPPSSTGFRYGAANRQTSYDSTGSSHQPQSSSTLQHQSISTLQQNPLSIYHPAFDLANDANRAPPSGSQHYSPNDSNNEQRALSAPPSGYHNYGNARQLSQNQRVNPPGLQQSYPPRDTSDIQNRGQNQHSQNHTVGTPPPSRPIPVIQAELRAAQKRLLAVDTAKAKKLKEKEAKDCEDRWDTPDQRLQELRETSERDFIQNHKWWESNPRQIFKYAEDLCSGTDSDGDDSSLATASSSEPPVNKSKGTCRRKIPRTNSRHAPPVHHQTIPSTQPPTPQDTSGPTPLYSCQFICPPIDSKPHIENAKYIDGHFHKLCKDLTNIKNAEERIRTLAATDITFSRKLSHLLLDKATLLSKAIFIELFHTLDHTEQSVIPAFSKLLHQHSEDVWPLVWEQREILRKEIVTLKVSNNNFEKKCNQLLQENQELRSKKDLQCVLCLSDLACPSCDRNDWSEYSGGPTYAQDTDVESEFVWRDGHVDYEATEKRDRLQQLNEEWIQEYNDITQECYQDALQDEADKDAEETEAEQRLCLEEEQAQNNRELSRAAEEDKRILEEERSNLQIQAIVDQASAANPGADREQLLLAVHRIIAEDKQDKKKDNKISKKKKQRKAGRATTEGGAAQTKN